MLQIICKAEQKHDVCSEERTRGKNSKRSRANQGGKHFNPSRLPVFKACQRWHPIYLSCTSLSAKTPNRDECVALFST